jgi:hypothetical protein
MNIRKLVYAAAAAVFILGGLSGAAQAQAPAKTAVAQEAKKITVQGKIITSQSRGGYFIRGEKPREVFGISNQNPEALAPLAKSGQVVTIAAKVVLGDMLAIETIDGKPYPEPKQK